MPEERRADDLQQRVLDAAASLFIHYGYDKTTVNEIAREAGVAKSTLYLRWKKKEDLFYSLLLREMRRYVDVWLARIEADPLGGTFAGMYRHAIALILEQPFMRAVFRGDRRMMGVALQKIGVTQLYVQRQATFTQFLLALQAVGVVRPDVDPHTVAYLATSLQYGFIKMGEFIPEENSPALDKLLAMMVDMLQGILAPVDGGDSEAGKAVLRRFMVQIRAQLEDEAMP